MIPSSSWATPSRDEVKTLFIIDNLEQVIDEAEATLGHWLQRAREAWFLVTSRTRLRLPEEVTLQLEPMDAATQGVDLFALRARSHRPGFSIGESERALVEHIVERLDGLPLAIELATSRLRMMSLEQFAGIASTIVSACSREENAGGTRHSPQPWTGPGTFCNRQNGRRSCRPQFFEGGFSLEAAEAVIDHSLETRCAVRPRCSPVAGGQELAQHARSSWKPTLLDVYLRARVRALQVEPR